MEEKSSLRSFDAALELLPVLSSAITVRSHYSEGHPAVVSADQVVATMVSRFLAEGVELVIAVVDNEFVLGRRPAPGLRQRFRALAEGMAALGVECVAFNNGVTPTEVCELSKGLAACLVEGHVAGGARILQRRLEHILLRFVILETEAAMLDRSEQAAAVFVDSVTLVLHRVATAARTDMKVPEDEIWSLGKTMFQAVKFGRFQLTPRVAKPSLRDEGTHATNVALLTAAMALEAGYSDELCMEATAAALMHDIGQFLLPEEIRGLPDFKLTPQQLPIAQNHAYAGALLLLGAGCPGLWVSAALEHHRCLDGGSYPELSTSDQPHELVRMIALANYFDSKRAVIDGFAEEPADIVLGAKGLASNYFGDGVLQCFLKSVGVYPPGLSVSLSDGETAVVERAEPSDPWRPSVRMLTGAQAGEVVDLRDVDKSHGTYKRSILWADVPMLLNESSGVMNPWELTSLA